MWDLKCLSLEWQKKTRWTLCKAPQLLSISLLTDEENSCYRIIKLHSDGQFTRWRLAGAADGLMVGAGAVCSDDFWSVRSYFFLQTHPAVFRCRVFVLRYLLRYLTGFPTVMYKDWYLCLWMFLNQFQVKIHHKAAFSVFYLSAFLLLKWRLSLFPVHAS